MMFRSGLDARLRCSSPVVVSSVTTRCSCIAQSSRCAVGLHQLSAGVGLDVSELYRMVGSCLRTPMCRYSNDVSDLVGWCYPLYVVRLQGILNHNINVHAQCCDTPKTYLTTDKIVGNRFQ